MGEDKVTVNVYDYNQKGQLFTYKISIDGQKVGAIYFNLETDRFTVSLTEWYNLERQILFTKHKQFKNKIMKVLTKRRRTKSNYNRFQFHSIILWCIRANI